MPPPKPITFTPRITYDNPATMSAVAKGIRVPPGLADTIPEPIFGNRARFDALLKAENGGQADRKLTFGLVTANVAVSFAEPATQWVKGDYRGTPWWRFQGGTIYVDLRLGLYIYDHFKTKAGDDCTFKVLARLVEHELLHIADELDIVTNWFPDAVKKDASVWQYLQEGMDDSTYQKWFVSEPYFAKRLRNDIWNEEHIRRIEARDSAKEYDDIEDEVRKLQMACKHVK